MSATEPPKTVNPAMDTKAHGKPAFSPANGLSTDIAVTSALVLLAALALSLTGCAVMETAMANAKLVATEMTTSAPEVGPYDPPATNAHPFIPPLLAEKPAPPAPAPTPATQPVLHPAEAKAAAPQPAPAPHAATFSPLPTPAPAPAPEIKGAARLMAANDPGALHVNARAADPPPAQTAPATSAAATVSAPVDSAPSLIFKGPPREPRHGVSVITIMIVVLFVSGLAVAAFALLHARRGKLKIAKGPPQKEKPPEGLEFKDSADMKEPAGHAPDTVLEA